MTQSPPRAVHHPSLARRLLVVEVVLVLALSLGRSGVYALVNLIASATAPGSLSSQKAVLNGSLAPGRPWLDLVYQLLALTFGVVPVLLVGYLLTRSDDDPRSLWSRGAAEYRRDALRGLALAAVVGGTGLAFYLVTYALGVNLTVVAEDLPAVWWRYPVLLLSALQNALLEEFVVVGYLMLRLRQIGRARRLGDRDERRRPRQLPPLPGARRLRRQRGDGRAVRVALHPMGPGDAAGRGAHGARRLRVRRVRTPGRPRGLAAALTRRPTCGCFPGGGCGCMLRVMTEPAPAPLEPLTEDWERALCVVAHPDDMEFGGAAAVARWTEQGKQVVYCMVTSGEAGIDGMVPDEARRVREAEQVESARIVGVDEVDFLGLPDGILEYGVDLRRVICEEVRLHRPEIVITNNFRDTWGGRNLNQADHIATGKAVMDAVRDAGNRWVFNEQLVGGRDPWGGVKQVWAAGSPQATSAVDITDTFDKGVAVAARPPGLHRRSRLEGLRPRGVPRGHVAGHRPAARRRARGQLRGLPDGLGRVARPATDGIGHRRRCQRRPRSSGTGEATSSSCGRSWIRMTSLVRRAALAAVTLLTLSAVSSCSSDDPTASPAPATSSAAQPSAARRCAPRSTT